MKHPESILMAIVCVLLLSGACSISVGYALSYIDLVTTGLYLFGVAIGLACLPLILFVGILILERLRLR